jgi:indolepyruvate ferredoxin oxidoreductase beta subunit
MCPNLSRSDKGERMKEFNVVIAGIGGQGSITLAYVLAQAAFLKGYDVKTSELHGLAQRYGSVPCHVRFGEKIYSSVIMEGEANLIIGLEPLETVRACYYGSKENGTIFVIDTKRIFPLSVQVCKEPYPSLKRIQKMLRAFGEKVFAVNASEAVKKLTGSFVASNIYLLGFCSAKKLIPIEKEFILEGMRKVLPEKLFDLNKKVFEEGEKEGLYGKG